eukprot:Pgem_evm1s12735
MKIFEGITRALSSQSYFRCDGNQELSIYDGISNWNIIPVRQAMITIPKIKLSETQTVQWKCGSFTRHLNLINQNYDFSNNNTKINDNDVYVDVSVMYDNYRVNFLVNQHDESSTFLSENAQLTLAQFFAKVSD